MNKTITIARLRRNGRLVRVKPDGAEEALDAPPWLRWALRKSKPPPATMKTHPSPRRG